jgi:hypothetical protein
MTDWDGQANWNRDVLERIVALLFALAGLADCAAGLPFLRRWQVLKILSRGEAEARAFVIGVATGESAPADESGPTGDAACLAASFRALALALCAMLAHAPRFALPGATCVRAGGQTPAESAGRQPPPPAPDTS